MSPLWLISVELSVQLAFHVIKNTAAIKSDPLLWKPDPEIVFPAHYIFLRPWYFFKTKSLKI